MTKMTTLALSRLNAAVNKKLGNKYTEEEALAMDTELYLEEGDEYWFIVGNKSKNVYGGSHDEREANVLLYKFEARLKHKGTTAMNSEQALIKGEDHYQWFVYTGKGPYPMPFRTNTYGLSKGDVFGVRYSANGKDRRLVIKDLGPNKVFTLTDEQNRHLSKNSKPYTK